MPSSAILGEIAEALNVPATSLDLSASFLDNGGNSLSLMRLQHALKSYGILLRYEAIFSIGTLAQLLNTAAQKAIQCRNERSFGTKRRRSTVSNSIPKRRRISKERQSLAVLTPNSTRCLWSCPMTDMQLAFLQAGLADPGMNVIHYHETHIPDNIPALKRAWGAVTDAEPILRSTYELSQPGAYLVEKQGTRFDWKETIVYDENTYYQIIQNEVLDGYKAFSSSFRVVTLCGSSGRAGKSRVIWRVHHALIDGYSHLLLLEKVRKYLAGEKVKPGTPFVHFAAGLHALQTTSYESAKAFWAKKYEEHPNSASRLRLPAPSRLSARNMLHFPIVDLKVDAEELSMRCRYLGFTLPTLFHTAWALTLAIYTDSDDVAFGTVLCGRSLPIPGVASVVGPTLNTLPVHIKLNRDSSFTNQMRQVFEQILELSSHQWTIPKHGFTREFRTVLNVQIGPHPSKTSAFETLETPFSTIRSNVSLQVEITHGGSIRLHYDPTQYSQNQIEGLAKVYESTLSLVRNASSSVETCLSSILTISQRNQLGNSGNWDSATTRYNSVRDDLVSLFMRAAIENPSEVALQRGKTKLTYSELDSKSTMLSKRIIPLVRPGSVVCVHADRSINWIVAIYAVLKAGCVYCPFYEQLPTTLRDQNFITSKAKLFIVGSNCDKVKKPQSCKLCLSVEDLLHGISPCPDGEILELRTRPDSGAYLCFTSGSTGKPKGVLCQHRGLVAFQGDINVRLRARPGWKIAQFMSPAFDGSIHEIFSALSYGATLLLEDRSNPLDHLRQADAAILTPSVAKALDPDEFQDLKVLYLVGEAVSSDVCDAWAKRRTLYNMYGPTEATCGATIKQLSPGDSITLGKPNPSTRIYILDRNQKLIPQGIIGEICLAGVQVSLGYVGLPEETARRFLLDPVCPQWGELMYRTGDIGYWNEEGELIFLGRSDRQIKLRGFRIDMDDLEIQILRADKEATAVAVALVDDDLVAQVQPKTLDLNRFKSRVRKQIPAYALPRHVMAVDAFPMTAVGKLDYKKMGQDTYYQKLEPDALQLVSALAFQERIIAAVHDILGPCSDEIIGPFSSFLDVVGTSMLLIALSHHLSKLLKCKIPVRLLLHSPTPQALAQSLVHVQNQDQSETSSVLGDSGTSSIEQDWWKKYQISPDTSAFNVNFVCELESTVDRARLASAWNAVLGRHRILRCNFQYSREYGVQRAYQEQPPTAQLVQSLDIDGEVHRTFDLQQDPLVRVLLSPSHMTVVISHIICDLTTLNALLQEVVNLYHGKLLVAVKPYSQTRWSTPAPISHFEFWSDYLSNATTPTYFGLKQNDRSSWAGTSHVISLPRATYEHLKVCAATQRVTMHQLALAAVALALENGDEEECDITIGAPYLNRNSEEDQHVIGLFLEPLPIRIRYSTPPVEHEQDSFIHTVQRSSRAALAHAVSFQHLLSHLSITPVYPTHPLFDVVVTFHEASQRPVFSIPGTKPLDTWTRGAKFKLMAEFSEVNEAELMLRLEYSTECFDKSGIVEIGNRVERALAGLSVGMGFEELRGCVRRRQG